MTTEWALCVSDDATGNTIGNNHLRPQIFPNLTHQDTQEFTNETNVIDMGSYKLAFMEDTPSYPKNITLDNTAGFEGLLMGIHNVTDANKAWTQLEEAAEVTT